MAVHPRVDVCPDWAAAVARALCCQVGHQLITKQRPAPGPPCRRRWRGTTPPAAASLGAGRADLTGAGLAQRWRLEGRSCCACAATATCGTRRKAAAGGGGAQIDVNVEREVLNHKTLVHPNVVQFLEVPPFCLPPAVPLRLLWHHIKRTFLN